MWRNWWSKQFSLNVLSAYGAFHLSELTGQIIPIVMRISFFNKNYSSRSVEF